MHRLLVAQQVGEMWPGIHPIIDIEDFLPSAFLVLSELPILRHKVKKRQSESPVYSYDPLVVVRIVWRLNVEDIAVHVTLILCHWFRVRRSEISLLNILSPFADCTRAPCAVEHG